MNLTFDHLKLRLPSASVKILSEGSFYKNIGTDGSLVSMTYTQEAPFRYRIHVILRRQVTVIEFSGKALLEHYPDLISIHNIQTCLSNINSFGICQIDPETVMNEAMVDECDVTVDVPFSGTIKDLQETSMLNSKYTVKKINRNRFYIETTYVTKRKTECMVIYDKNEEFNRPCNAFFLKAVSNGDEQREFFSDKVRLELNIRSVDRIRKFFNLKTPTLLSVLNSTSDPIGTFLSQAVRTHSLSNFLADNNISLKDLQHLTILLLSGFDMNNVRRIINLVKHKNRSMPSYIKPYEDLYERLVHKGVCPEADFDIASLQNHLQNVICKTLCTEPEGQRKTINSLYTQYKDQSCQNAQIEKEPVQLYNISMIFLPPLLD